MQLFLHCSCFCIAVVFALRGALGKLKPFSLSLGFLGFAGGGLWSEGGVSDDEDRDQLFLHCMQLFGIAVCFELLDTLGFLSPNDCLPLKLCGSVYFIGVSSSLCLHFSAICLELL